MRNCYKYNIKKKLINFLIIIIISCVDEILKINLSGYRQNVISLEVKEALI